MSYWLTFRSHVGFEPYSSPQSGLVTEHCGQRFGLSPESIFSVVIRHDWRECMVTGISHRLGISLEGVVLPDRPLEGQHMTILGAPGQAGIVKRMLLERGASSGVFPSTIEIQDRSFVQFGYTLPKATAHPMKALSELGFRNIKPLFCRPRSSKEVQNLVKGGSVEANMELIRKTYREFGFEAQVGFVSHNVVTHKGTQATTRDTLRSISYATQLAREKDYLRISARILDFEDIGLTLDRITGSTHTDADIINFLKRRGRKMGRSELRLIKKIWVLAELYYDSIKALHRGGMANE
jgi:hypothetical protein